MKARKLIAAGLVLTLILTIFAGCGAKEESAVINNLFTSRKKIGYSENYYELSSTKKNDTETWRQGMVSGDGKQGFITSGSPYSDSIIYQNIHFIMPNENTRSCPVVSDELETVKQAIVNGEDITDDASYDDVYRYHPGGAFRIEQKECSEKDYVRYTNYETAEVGVHYTDKNGTWDRVSFTSKADDVSITKILQSDSGSKVTASLSFDDIETMANYGDSDEVNMKHKVLVGDDYVCFVAHYPDYEKSELKNGGYATMVYIITDGSVEKADSGINVTDAGYIYLIANSGRDSSMGKIDAFDEAETYDLCTTLLKKCQSVEKKYTVDGSFSYDAALASHTALFTPEYDAVDFTLAGDDSNKSNESLIKLAKSSDGLEPEMVTKAYYSGRYAYLCCAGYSTSRLYGMWTGEFNTGWGSKYTMDANVNLQVSSMNTSNMTDTYIGYINFILRQLPDWEENALATHGYTDAIQAPVNTDGDCAVINETCYSYPFRYWNAGASWMITPMYETLLSYGDVKVPLSAEFDLKDLKSVLNLTDSDIKTITKRGYLNLREDILYPMLLKSCNYWVQLVSPEYYTTKDGEIKYEEGKKSLEKNEYYAILPSYSPENNPSNYASPSVANSAIDISACRENVEMLIAVSKTMGKKVAAKYKDLLNNLPPYLYDDTGALKEWATVAFDENNEHRHLSHLYCAWPLTETQDNEELRQACIQAINNRASENSASHALIHRALIADRLKDSSALTEALHTLMTSKIYYDSLMTNHNFKRNSCYCTDYEIGYLGIINEALLYSDEGYVEVLPALPESGFDSGSISGLRIRSQATADLIEWNMETGVITVKITSDIDQTLKIASPLSSDTYEVNFNAGQSQTFRLTVNATEAE